MSGAFLAGEAILNPATGCKFPLHLIVCRQAGLTFRQHGPCLCAVFMCIPAALRAPWARLKLGGRGGGESGRQKSKGKNSNGRCNPEARRCATLSLLQIDEADFVSSGVCLAGIIKQGESGSLPAVLSWPQSTLNTALFNQIPYLISTCGPVPILWIMALNAEPSTARSKNVWKNKNK